MMINEKLYFLRKYNKDLDLIAFDELSFGEKNSLPIEWQEIFYLQDFCLKKDALINLWNRDHSVDLRNTISYLNEFLKELDLIRINGSLSIVYTLSDQKGKTFYYEGKNPKSRILKLPLKENWDRLPLSLKKFYENLHNGFFFYSSHSMGLVPTEEITYLDDLEWGILEEIKEPLEIDLKTPFGFFTNGMGGYVAVDTATCTSGNATLWWSDEAPEYNQNFWDVVDEWIVIGFEN